MKLDKDTVMELQFSIAGELFNNLPTRRHSLQYINGYKKATEVVFSALAKAKELCELCKDHEK